MICNDCYFMIIKEDNKKYCQHSFSHTFEILQDVLKCPVYQPKMELLNEENSN